MWNRSTPNTLSLPGITRVWSCLCRIAQFRRTLSHTYTCCHEHDTREWLYTRGAQNGCIAHSITSNATLAIFPVTLSVVSHAVVVSGGVVPRVPVGRIEPAGGCCVAKQVGAPWLVAHPRPAEELVLHETSLRLNVGEDAPVVGRTGNVVAIKPIRHRRKRQTVIIERDRPE